MPLSERERQVLYDIHQWESKLFEYAPNDFELTIDKWMDQAFSLLPEEFQISFFEQLDTWLFHLHAMIQGTSFQTDARNRILTTARTFNEQIERINDLPVLTIDQLTYLANQHIGRHRFYSFIQGGLAGTGQTVFLGSDIPAMSVINLRIVQLTAMAYGYDVNIPKEMMTSLKVFHYGTLPIRMQGEGWNILMQELAVHEDTYFFEGDEKLTDISWFEQPLTHILKGLSILFLKQKVCRKLPIVSMAIGAGANYQLTKKVTDFANRYYQYRYLVEKGNL